MENNLTSGSVLSAMLRFSPPFFLSYFLQTLYGMADLYIIGQYCGVAQTTAVALGSQVMHMITVMIVGLAMGATIKIGKSVGAQEREETALAIGNTVTLFMLLSLVLTVVLLLLTEPIVQLIQTPAEAVAGTCTYLRICFLGIPAITAYNIISAVFRGLGNSKSPMYLIAVACVANIALDYLFIGAFHMGPAGAALGTVCAQLLSVVLALLVLRRSESGLGVKRSHFAPCGRVFREILRVGVPVAIQDGFIQVSFIVISVIVNMRGVNDAAAVGIVEKIISFLFLVPSSMLATVSALGAQYIGAGKPERVRQTLGYAVLFCVLFGVVITLVMQLAAEPVVALFNRDETVIYMGGLYMKGYILDSIFAGIHFCFSGYFCACGKSIYSFLHNALSIVLARIPLAYIASVSFPDTLLPMGLATATGSLVSAVICLLLYRHMRKEEKRMEGV